MERRTHLSNSHSSITLIDEDYSSDIKKTKSDNSNDF